MIPTVTISLAQHIVLIKKDFGLMLKTQTDISTLRVNDETLTSPTDKANAGTIFICFY